MNGNSMCVYVARKYVTVFSELKIDSSRLGQSDTEHAARGKLAADFGGEREEIEEWDEFGCRREI